MRPLVLVGIILIVIGGFLLYRGGSFTTQEKIVEVGDVSLTAPEKHSVPKWIAGVAVVAGIGLVIAGAAQRKS